MTEEEKVEYRIKCAEFLGMYDYSKDNEYFEKRRYFKYSEESKNPPCGYFNMTTCFITDWSSIMEVVEAIEKLDNYYTQIEEQSCYIYDISTFDDNQTDPIIISDGETKKEAIVNAINQFLKLEI